MDCDGDTRPALNWFVSGSWRRQLPTEWRQKLREPQAASFANAPNRDADATYVNSRHFKRLPRLRAKPCPVRPRSLRQCRRFARGECIDVRGRSTSAALPSQPKRDCGRRCPRRRRYAQYRARVCRAIDHYLEPAEIIYTLCPTIIAAAGRRPRGYREDAMRNGKWSRRDVLKTSTAFAAGALFAEPLRGAAPPPTASRRN